MRCDILTYNTHGLPWSKDISPVICSWIKDTLPPIVCLQEVFLNSTRLYYKEQLTRFGYTVVLPHDTGVTMISSGLVTAFLDRVYTLTSDCFCPYLSYSNVEYFANKGFHILKLRDKSTSEPVCIVNTHVQSDTEISWLIGHKITHHIRKQQIQQILDFLEKEPIPVLIVGDLNCEHSPHPHLRFLRPPYSMAKKHTFFSTGEDLDHIGWLLLQYAIPGCSFCDVDRRGPILESCQVYTMKWSDHAPLRMVVRLSKTNTTGKKGDE